MDITQIQLPENISIKDFRDIAKNIAFHDFRLNTLKQVMEKQKLTNPEKLLDFLLKHQYISNTESREKNVYYANTSLRSVANASLNKRKNKSYSWNALAKAIIRAEVIQHSSIDWAINKPKSIFLFGSMLDNSKENYGDADIIVSFSVEEQQQQNYYKLKEKIANKYTNNNIFDYKTYGEFGFQDETQIKIDIKNNNTFLSFCTERTAESLSKEDKYLNKTFPLIQLWKTDNTNLHISVLDKYNENLANKWAIENQTAYHSVIDNLNHALNQIGVSNINSPNFKKDCKHYVQFELLNQAHLLAEEDLLYYSKQSTKMRRFGNLGIETLGIIAKYNYWSLETIKKSEDIEINKIINNPHFKRGYKSNEKKELVHIARKTNSLKLK